MVAVVHKVRSCGRLKIRPRCQYICCCVIQAIREFFSGRNNHSMLLQKPVHYQSSPGVPLDKSRVCNVLLGMMETIRIVSQVEKDIAHKAIIRTISAVEGSDLFIQQIK